MKVDKANDDLVVILRNYIPGENEDWTPVRIAQAADTIEQYRADAKRDEEVNNRLRADLERARKALEEIQSWKDDTLGPRPKEFGPLDCDPSISSAFDRGVRMAFYRCSNHAGVALAVLAH